MQQELFDLAISLDDERSQSAAAIALLNARDVIDQQLVDAITTDQVVTCHVKVASFLVLLLGARGELSLVQATAKALAGNKQRRVFLFLLAGTLNQRNSNAAREIVQLITVDPVILEWAAACGTTTIDESLIAYFGDPAAVAQVVRYMGAKA